MSFRTASPDPKKRGQSRIGISPLFELPWREMPVAPYRCPEGRATYGFSAAFSASLEGIRPQRNFGSG